MINAPLVNVASQATFFLALFCKVEAGGNTMKKDVIFILDRSGSMSGLESDTIGGFNSLIQKQKKLEGDIAISTLLFDDHMEWLHERAPLSSIELLTDASYFVRGTTALLDAIGLTLTQMSTVYQTLGAEKPDQVMVVIMTDGHENASKEYSLNVVKTLVQTFKEEAKWEFLFLGANIDAVDTGMSMGIDKARTVNFLADEQGMQTNYRAVENAMHEFRTSGKISNAWRNEINQDYKRKKK
jgi:uncharacterized protein YegL